MWFEFQNVWSHLFFIAQRNIGWIADYNIYCRQMLLLALVQEIHWISPRTKILLMGLFPRDASPTSPFRQEVAETNRLISGLDDGQDVRFLDIGPELLQPDGSISPTPGTATATPSIRTVTTR